ncbi:MAG: phosphoribosylformylglycinamidine synthase subunit PurQ [Deltaproteobacteria bacterium]
MKVGIVVFPGSNCDHDAYHAVRHVLGHDARFLWHKDTSVGDVDRIVLPGGFSYGDYLRSGALARFSPIMADVRRFADAGGPVLGICNGFQVLCEAGMLPGALARNASLKFICQDVHVRVEAEGSRLTRGLAAGAVLRLPIAHADGNYTLGEAELDALERAGQVLFRYCDAQGKRSPEANPNGSQRAIAGVRNERGNVVGLMPHPERASEAILGSTDGRRLLESFLT